MPNESESLEETLTFLDEALRGSDSVLHGNTSPLHPPLPDDEYDQELGGPTQRSRPKKRKKNPNHNRAREERQAELVALRGEVENLEFTLKRLRTIRSDGSSIGSSHLENKTERGESVWKDACIRQLERRLRAERENMHLVKSVEQDKQLIKSLERLLDVRPALWSMPYPGTRKITKRVEIPPGYIKHVTDLIFDELSAGVEVTYGEVKCMNRTVDPLLMQSMTCEPILRHGLRGDQFEAIDRRVVPFDVRQTGDAWWQHWHNYRGQHADDNTENVVTESFGLEITDAEANMSATFYVQQVLQRHVEDHHTVFVWNTYVEPLAFKKKRVGGVYYREQSYVLIKPGAEGCANAKSTLMSSHEVITPHFLDSRLTKDATTTALTKFLMGSMPSDIKARNEMVESLLVDQTLQTRRHV